MSFWEKGKGKVETQRQRGEGHVYTEEEIIFMVPQTKGYMEISEHERSRKDSPPGRRRGVWPQ